MANINNVFEKPPTRIKEMIKKSGKKLKEISQESGVPYGALSSYNQGTRKPKEENAKKLANYFGVSIPYLLGLDDNPVLVNPGSTKEIFKGFAKGKENEINDLIFELSLIQINKKELLEQYLTLDSQEKNILTKVKEIYHENY